MKIVWMDSCASTNDEAWNFFDPQNPVCLIARKQTSGRGQHGRSWIATETGLAASFIFFPDRAPLNLLPLAAGIAAIEACSAFYVDRGWPVPNALRLKWPNDLYIGDAKLAGVLCESRMRGERAAGAVIGVGMNLLDAPNIPAQKTIALLGDRVRLSELDFVREELCKKFWNFFEPQFENLRLGQIEVLRENWNFWSKSASMAPPEFFQSLS